MKNVAFMFPGQGSQYVGMGKYFYENFSESRIVFEKTNEILGFSISDKIFNGSMDEISDTKITQPSILAVSIAIMEALKGLVDIRPACTAGLSLGEYSALVCSGILDFDKSIPLVNKRADFMVNSLDGNSYGMTAVIGLNKDKILQVIDDVKSYGHLEIANYNCPSQIVVSGEASALDIADEMFKKRGALRSVRLPIKSPFHTSFLKEAALKFKKELENTEFNIDFNIPVISNVTADKMDRNRICELLSNQIMSSVLWEDSILKIIEMGIDTFVEIGPGRSLSSFVKKIDRRVTVLNIEDESSLNKSLKVLSGV